MKRVHVANDGWNFETEDGSPITPIGGNVLNPQHPGQGTLFRAFDADACDRTFGLMADSGLNCLRQPIGVNQVFDPQTGLKADGLKQWDTFIDLAEKHGVYLMPVGGYLGGNDWFDAEILADSDQALDNDCAFWAAFAGHYRDHPAIWSWDLRNELLYDIGPHMTVDDKVNADRVDAMLKDRWPEYLEAKYATVEAMNRIQGGAAAGFDDVDATVAFDNKPFDMATYDFECYLAWRGYQWCKRQCDVIRSVSPKHMIVSGNNQWLHPDLDLHLARGFQAVFTHDLFDFVTIHPYPAPQACDYGYGDPLDSAENMDYFVRVCIALARIDFYRKPVVMQEFGWYGGGESSFLCPLPYRSEQEHADYTRELTERMKPHVNGFVNWPLVDMPEANDISNHGGIFTHDGGRKALASVYEDLSRDMIGKRHERAEGNAMITLSLLGLFTSRKHQDQMWQRVTDAIADGVIPDFQCVS